MSSINDQLINILQVIIGGALAIASAFLPVLIHKAVAIANAKVQKIKNEQAREFLDNTLSRVDDLIITNIVSAENTLKPTILQAIADGKVDKTELNSLSALVKENVLNQMSKQAIEIFNSSLSDANGYLTNRIEKILAELKSSPGTEVNKTVIVEPKVEESGGAL
jgi:hypothetical protein